MSASNSDCGNDGGNGGQVSGRGDVPKSLAREGHVVWFYKHNQYLGFEWSESAREIQKAHVDDSEHAIYFDTYAHAVVASEKLTRPSLILYSPGSGKPLKVKG